jgi:hypothetical protein
MNGFGIDELSTKAFLWHIGIIDILAAIALFIPKIRILAIYYMIIWGFLTSMARLVGNYHDDLFFETFNQYWFQVVFRFGHFLVPIWLFYNQKKLEYV